MHTHISPLKRYRATLIPQGTPADQVESLAQAASLPVLRLKAPSAEYAQAAAHRISGLAVLDVQRIEGGE